MTLQCHPVLYVLAFSLCQALCEAPGEEAGLVRKSLKPGYWGHGFFDTKFLPLGVNGLERREAGKQSAGGTEGPQGALCVCGRGGWRRSRPSLRWAEGMEVRSTIPEPHSALETPRTCPLFPSHTDSCTKWISRLVCPRRPKNQTVQAQTAGPNQTWAG